MIFKAIISNYVKLIYTEVSMTGASSYCHFVSKEIHINKS